MSVENLGLARGATPGNLVAVALDCLAGLGPGPLQAGELSVGAPGLTFGRRARGSVKVPDRAERDPGRRRDPGQRCPRLRRRRWLGRAQRNGGSSRSGRGRRGSRVGDSLAESAGGELRERRHGIGRLRAGRGGDELVALAGGQRHQTRQTARTDRWPGGAGLGQPQVGVEPRRQSNHERCRPGVQSDRVDHRDPRLGIDRHRIRVRRRRLRCSGHVTIRDLVASELGSLHPQRALGLGPDLIERRATPRRGRRSHRALHERGLAHHHAPAALHQLDRHLGAHQRAAQVHQHEHAVVGHRPLDRGADAFGIGPHRPVLEPAGLLERQVLASHLTRERDHSPGELS